MGRDHHPLDFRNGHKLVTNDRLITKKASQTPVKPKVFIKTLSYYWFYMTAIIYKRTRLLWSECLFFDSLKNTCMQLLIRAQMIANNFIFVIQIMLHRLFRRVERCLFAQRHLLIRFFLVGGILQHFPTFKKNQHLMITFL